MSYTEKHLGRLRKVDLQGKSLEEWCKEYCESHGILTHKYGPSFKENPWTATFKYYQENRNKFFIIDNNVYQMLHHREITEDFDVFWFEPDGDIQFAVEFYNGGTCLEEVMEDGVKRLEKAKNYEKV